MFQHMFLQRVLMLKRSAAHCARKRYLLVRITLVLSHISTLLEPRRTMHTLVQLCICMRRHVLVQRFLALELTVATVTLERPLLGMRDIVGFEAKPLLEVGTTDLALEWSLGGVLQHMAAQISPTPESVAAL